MDDAPNIVIAIIINVIFYIVVPLIMIYRRGYFINFSERLEWIKNILNRKNASLPEEWTVIKIRPFSAFEKYQIQKVVVKFMPENRDGYWAVIILNSGKHRLFKLGENGVYWIDNEIHKDNIRLRAWQKSTQHKYDISIIISGMSKFNNQ